MATVFRYHENHIRRFFDGTTRQDVYEQPIVPLKDYFIDYGCIRPPCSHTGIFEERVVEGFYLPRNFRPVQGLIIGLFVPIVLWMTAAFLGGRYYSRTQ
jgi:hypothetical protein